LYNLTASASGYSPQTNNGVSVSAGNTTTSNFSLAPVASTGTLKGKVTDANTTSAISGATVQIQGGASTSTNSTGNYTFNNVAPGTYSLTVSAAGYTTQTVTGVTVTSGNTTTKNVALSPTGGASLPGAPGNLVAKKAGFFARGTRLTWTAAANNGSALTGYRVYRSTSSGTEILIAMTGVTTSYSDSATTSGVTYYYKVSAVNGLGEGPQSNEASAQAR
jgi:hypothetical protein